MSTSQTPLPLALGLSLLAMLTAWATLLSWRPLTERSSDTLVPLLGLALLLATTGAVMRWLRLSPLLVVALQLLLTATAVVWGVGGSFPLTGGWAEYSHLLGEARDSAQQYVAPVPATVPAVHPLLITAGAWVLLAFDTLASTWRRVPLAGLVLLCVYTVPLAVTGRGVSWFVFVLAAAGFLALLHAQHTQSVTRWGRGLRADGTVSDTVTEQESPEDSFGVRTGFSSTVAARLGIAAVVLAVAVPLALPTLDLGLLDRAGPGSGGGDVDVVNPIADMRRDLIRGGDDPLVEITTDDPDPSYLRISVLRAYNGRTWTPGNRAIPREQAATGALPPPQGVGASVERTPRAYDARAYPRFRSNWLPTMQELTWVRAGEDWRYDLSTRDFLTSDPDRVNTSGISWSMRAEEYEYDLAALDNSPSGAAEVGREYIDLPGDLPPIVTELAREVTADEPTRFRKARALQAWFRDPEEFTYTLAAPQGNGNADLATFLSEDGEGRRGYCEQFASAMAVMARSLDIPARVVIGFLTPERTGEAEGVGGVFEFSAWDMHAWPELYFPGSGWVAFEPTPPTRASNVPAWTSDRLPERPEQTTAPTAQPSDDVAPNVPQNTPTPEAVETTSDEENVSVLPLVVALVAVVLLVGFLLALPRLVRRRRAHQRERDGDVESAWLELRDRVLDLGLVWPVGRSPRETGARTASLLPFVDGPAHDALGRLVEALEEARYAPPGRAVTPPGLFADVDTVSADLTSTRSVSLQRRARWWPATVVQRRARRERVRPVADQKRGTLVG